ncbi:MAG: hypothetical protein ACK5O7_02720 [Holosporales bacterium]
MTRPQGICRKSIMGFFGFFGLIFGMYDHSLASPILYESNDDSSSLSAKSNSFSSDSALSDSDDFDPLDLRDLEAISVPATQPAPSSTSSTSAQQQDEEHDLYELRMHRVMQVRYFSSLKLEPQQLNAIETLLDHPSVAAHLTQFPVQSQRKDLKTRENLFDYYFRELAAMTHAIESISDFLVDKRLRMVYEEAEDLIRVAHALCPLSQHLDTLKDKIFPTRAVNAFRSSKSLLKLLMIFAAFPDRVPQMASFIARDDLAATYANTDEMCAWLDFVHALGCGYDVSAWDMYCHLRDVDTDHFSLPDQAKSRIKRLRERLVRFEGKK